MLRDRKREEFDDYVTRRAFRLFPLYLIVLAVSALLLPVQLGAWHALAPSPVNLGRTQLVQSATDALWAHLAVHATLLQGLPPVALAHQVPFTLVGQAWSISLEWQFYIVAPLLIAAMTSRNLLKLAGVAAAVLALAFVARWFSDAFLGARILHFVIGIASYFAVKGKDRRSWIAACVLAGLLVL
jgi:peptidoglycan/LPS O-acetylase OafA/YrhL